MQKNIPFSAFKDTDAPGFAAIEYVTTLAEYQCPSYRGLNKAAQKGLPTWAYEFNHTDTCAWIPEIPSSKQVLKLLGPTHTAEIPFVFEETSRLPRPNGTCKFDAAEVALSRFISQAWTNMADKQQPSTDESVWPAYLGPAVAKGLIFNDRPVAGQIDFKPCELFDQIRDAQLAAARNTTKSCSSNGTETGGGTPAVATYANAAARESGLSITGLTVGCSVLMALSSLM